MITSMTIERVTVSLPADVKAAAQQVATHAGVPFSSVVSEALAAWLRSRLVDAWLAQYQVEFGAFTEDELQDLAAEVGMVYLPPSERSSAA
jgi:hypothetical protein